MAWEKKTPTKYNPLKKKKRKKELSIVLAKEIVWIFFNGETQMNFLANPNVSVKKVLNQFMILLISHLTCLLVRNLREMWCHGLLRVNGSWCDAEQGDHGVETAKYI